MKQKLPKNLKTGNWRCLSVINQSESLTLINSVSAPALMTQAGKDTLAGSAFLFLKLQVYLPQVS